jgi:L-seryl-tRNA(Ser) seleniumtransferase
MAVDMWVKRNHEAEWKRWTAALEHIAGRLTTIDGVSTSMSQPEGLSNRTPSLRVLWNRPALGISGDDVVRTLFETEPRVALAAAGGGDPARTGVTVTPYQMSPGEEKIVADRLHFVLSRRAHATTATAAPPAADLTGRWEVRIEYAAGVSTHVFQLNQKGNAIGGSHQGDFVSRDLSGTIDGDAIRIRSNYPEQHGDALSFTFSGRLTGNEIAGTLDMGEYLRATWTAKRRA